MLKYPWGSVAAISYTPIWGGGGEMQRHRSRGDMLPRLKILLWEYVSPPVSHQVSMEPRRCHVENNYWAALIRAHDLVIRAHELIMLIRVHGLLIRVHGLVIHAHGLVIRAHRLA